MTFVGSGGIRSTARPELPYSCKSQAKSRHETSRGGSNVTARSHVIPFRSFCNIDNCNCSNIDNFNNIALQHY